MKVVVDRLVQYPNRFQLVNVDTSAVLGVFDFNAVTGSVVQVGTEINAELFDSIQADLTALAQDIVNESTERRANVVDLMNSIATKITANGGEIGNTIATFGISNTTNNIASGEKVSTIFSKIQNWFSRLKPLAFKSRIEDDDVSITANIDQSKIFGLTAMQTKLNGIEAGANKYTLPSATANDLGGVKVGSRLSVATDGTISADVQSEANFTQAEKTKLAGISTGANKYTLPTASTSTLGGVKVGTNLSIDSSGVLSGFGLKQFETSIMARYKSALVKLEEILANAKGNVYIKGTQDGLFYNVVVDKISDTKKTYLFTTKRGARATENNATIVEYRYIYVTTSSMQSQPSGFVAYYGETYSQESLTTSAIPQAYSAIYYNDVEI